MRQGRAASLAGSVTRRLCTVHSSRLDLGRDLAARPSGAITGCSRKGSSGTPFVRTAVSLLFRSTGLLVTALLAAACVVGFTATALAAPEWGITMTHQNAYGAQAASCPGGHESLPGEPDCGVDPFTGSGTTFAQESGDNAYTIKVKNTAGQAAGSAVGETLTCETGTWEYSPTFSYRWLRNGVAISGAEASEYTLAVADEGKAVQCQVTGTNTAGSVSATTVALTVSPGPSTEPPALTSEVKVTGESGTIAVNDKPTCTPGEWSGSPTFSYRWLRNGAPIAGAESATYEVVTADEGTSLQCEVIATNAGGSA